MAGPSPLVGAMALDLLEREEGDAKLARVRVCRAFAQLLAAAAADSGEEEASRSGAAIYRGAGSGLPLAAV